MSDDGEYGLTLIGFIGSVFSPYYAHARRHNGPGRTDPSNYCALNVALYRRRGAARWSMTERSGARVERTRDRLQIGPSAMHWQADSSLIIDIDEITVPYPTRLRGQVRVHPQALSSHAFDLDVAGVHRWQPIAPVARVDVDMTEPGLHWSGAGYLDSNRGDAPLERHFHGWQWSRAALAGQRCAVVYDVQPLAGAARCLALEFDKAGQYCDVTPPMHAALPASRWKIARFTRGQSGRARIEAVLEDGPFYARSLVSTQWGDQRVSAVHESLSLARFRQRWVQSLLPFRMPRRPG